MGRSSLDLGIKAKTGNEINRFEVEKVNNLVDVKKEK
jgi:hypothetical protein